MPPKKRQPSAEQPAAKRIQPDGDVIVVLVSAPEIPVLDTFVVPLDALDTVDRSDVEWMLKWGLAPDEAHVPTDPDNRPTDWD